MTICKRCHRPLKRPTESGYGPVCAKLAKPVPEIDRDLFGYDIEAAVFRAKQYLAVTIAYEYAMARHAIKAEFRDARERLGVAQ